MAEADVSQAGWREPASQPPEAGAGKRRGASSWRVVVWWVMMALLVPGFYIYGETRGWANGASAFEFGYMTGAALLFWGMLAKLGPGFRFPVSLVALLAAGWIGEIVGSERVTIHEFFNPEPEVHSGVGATTPADPSAPQTATNAEMDRLESLVTDAGTRMKSDPDFLNAETDFDTGSSIQGQEVGVMLNLMRTYLREEQLDHAAYLADLDALGWSGILDPARLAADADLAGYYAIADAARDRVRRQREVRMQKAESYLDGYEAAAVSDMTRMRLAVGGWQRERDASTARVTSYWDLELQVIDAIAAQLDVLRDAEGGWSVEGDMMMFETQAEVDRWSAGWARIQALANQQEALAL